MRAANMLLVFFSPSLICAQTTPWPLITDADVARESASDVPIPFNFRTNSHQLAPVIVIHTPNTTDNIQSPTDIRLSFKAAEDAVIRAETFRLKYGALGIDVTDRIVSRFKPTAAGLSIEKAELPPGNHIFVMSIEDTKDRKGFKRFSVRVLKP